MDAPKLTYTRIVVKAFNRNINLVWQVVKLPCGTAVDSGRCTCATRFLEDERSKTSTKAGLIICAGPII
jgi:hypothetical protein